jgi:hypothetical protein
LSCEIEHRNNHEDAKYMMDQARLPPGASGAPKHMHLVTPISSEWPERRNRKAPTP